MSQPTVLSTSDPKVILAAIKDILRRTRESVLCCYILDYLYVIVLDLSS